MTGMYEFIKVMQERFSIWGVPGNLHWIKLNAPGAITRQLTSDSHSVASFSRYDHFNFGWSIRIYCAMKLCSIAKTQLSLFNSYEGQMTRPRKITWNLFASLSWDETIFHYGMSLDVRDGYNIARTFHFKNVTTSEIQISTTTHMYYDLETVESWL